MPTYRILGTEREPLNLVSRPGWRTIVVGATGQGSLLGVVARVEYQEERARYCQGLGHMQAQLQTLLDGLRTVTPPPVTTPPPPPPPRPESLPLRPY
jgi:hypothetical protein